MKNQILHIGALILLTSSCFTLSRNLTRSVENTFVESDLKGVSGLLKYDFNMDNLYTLRVREYANPYIHLNGGDSMISDIPYRNFVELESSLNGNGNIVDEIHLYLNEFDTKNSGLLLYMISFPLLPESANVYFNNGNFISTATIRELRVGEWRKTANPFELEIKYEVDEGKAVYVKARKMKTKSGEEKIDFTHISHPKVSETRWNIEGDRMLLDMKHVVGLNNEQGLTFLKNKRVKVLYPLWGDMGKYMFDQKTLDHYSNIINYRFIDSLYVSPRIKPENIHFMYYNAPVGSINRKKCFFKVRNK